MFSTKVLLIAFLALWSPVASDWINKQLAKQQRQLSRDEQQPQLLTKCSAGFYPVIRKPGCFPKIGVVCLKNYQCSTLTANSYCGLKDIDNEALRVCLCKSGYSETSGEGDDDYDDDGVYAQPPKCLVNEVCSLDQFNSAMFQSNCSSPNAFCRRKVCLCKPGFVLDNYGNCKSSQNLEELHQIKLNRKKFQTDTLNKLTNEVHILQDKVEQMRAEKIWSYLITGFFTLFSLLITVVVGYNVFQIRQIVVVENRNRFQQGSFQTDPLVNPQAHVPQQNEN